MADGLLIVNADDWGLDISTTDAIATCFKAGRVTSATAMVYMADSERAATLANAAQLPLGLHLNLSEAFTAAAVPRSVRHRQAVLTTRFGNRHRRWRRWIPDRSIRAHVDRAVADQLTQFEVLYGRPPTHVDGHKHVQVSPTVALTPALADVMLRRAFSDLPGARSPAAPARELRHRLTRSRGLGTDKFFPIRTMADDLLAGRIPTVLEATRHQAVEVMVHPAAPAEHALLMTDAWARVLDAMHTGTYADLR